MKIYLIWRYKDFKHKSFGDKNSRHKYKSCSDNDKYNNPNEPKVSPKAQTSEEICECICWWGLKFKNQK